jgi:hypothetical protein
LFQLITSCHAPEGEIVAEIDQRRWMVLESRKEASRDSGPREDDDLWLEGFADLQSRRHRVDAELHLTTKTLEADQEVSDEAGSGRLLRVDWSGHDHKHSHREILARVG